MIGSPPQVRGKHDTTVPAVRQYRITPAGAGKTRHGRTDSGCHRDHPRGCRENHKLTVMCSDGKGSPPQVRGKLVDIVVWVVGLRITPAGAGKTVAAIKFGMLTRDHPRRCGENNFIC